MSKDSNVVVTSSSDDITGSTEGSGWDTGESVEDAEAKHGIRIRRRPLTGPPTHMVGPFEFRLENEGNTPQNILEKIIWDKDVEVQQACSGPTCVYIFECLFLEFWVEEFCIRFCFLIAF